MSEYRVDILKPKTLPEGLVEDAFSIASKIVGPIKYRLVEWDYEPYSEMASTKVRDEKILYSLSEDCVTDIKNYNTPEPIPIGSQINTLQEVLSDCIEIANDYRANLSGGQMPDLVIVLTTRGNTNNFFAEGASKTLPTAMIQVNHTVMQEGNPHLLLAYYFAAFPLKALGFNEEDYIDRYAHIETMGCMNDLGASNVYHLRIKTKTADICSDCKSILREKNVPYEIIKHARQIFNLVREKQINIEDIFENWEEHMMVVGNNLHFPNIGKSANLSPLELAVYLLFLKENEGMRYNRIDEHKQYFNRLYGRYSRLNSNEEIDEVVSNICNIEESAPLRQVVAKCNKKIKKCLEVNYESFLIKGPNGENKAISCDRSLVSFESGWEI